jgi:hypothetical protein
VADTGKSPKVREFQLFELERIVADAKEFMVKMRNVDVAGEVTQIARIIAD